MKKNILLVQSFLAIPLLTSSFIFTSQKPKKTYATVTELRDSGSQGRTPLSRKQKREAKKQAEKKELDAPQTRAPIAIPQIQDDYTPSEESSSQSNSVIINDIPADAPQVTEEAKETQTESVKSVVDYLTPEDKAHAESDLNQAKCHQTPERREILNVINDLSSEDKGLNHADSVVKSSLETYYARQQDTNVLEKSTTLGLETKARGFGLLGSVSNKFKRTNVQAVMSYLTSNTFEVDNQDHLNLLDKAIIECANTHDMESLLAIAKTCEEKYPSIRFSDTTSFFQFLSETYKKQVNASQLTLQGYNQQYAEEFNKKSAELKAQILQLSNNHKEMTAKLAQTYNDKIKEEQKKIKELENLIVNTSVLLDRHNSLKKVTLFAQNPLTIPANRVGDVEHTTNQRLTSLITSSNLPLIQAPVSK